MGACVRLAVLSAVAGLVGCGGEDLAQPREPAADGGLGSLPDAGLWPDAGGAETDSGSAAPKARQPCQDGDCWDAPTLGGVCGTTSISEDFSTGLYNVHEYALAAPAAVPVDLTLKSTAGAWSPALVVHDSLGATVHDGQTTLSTGALSVQLLDSGLGGDTASVRITAQQATPLAVFATSWEVIGAGFSTAMPADAAYSLTAFADCATPGGLLSPPNFDPNDVDGGFYLLPDSEPPGLYTKKPDDCSRGTKLLIDVLYTVAYHWKALRPSLAPIAMRDLNEGSCSTVDHATHDDGTHADLVAGCATEVACTDNAPAIDLAKLFVDTGKVCGILNNDTEVQKVVNAYFASKFSYEPWKGQFMRSVTGHTQHFHVRVMKPDGTCN